MGPHEVFHVEIFFRHIGDDAVLLRDHGFALGDAGAIGVGSLRLASLGAPVPQCSGQVLQRLPLPEVQQAGRNLVLVTQIQDGHLVAQVPARDHGLLLRREDPAGVLDRFFRGTHDNLRCSIVRSGWCHISTGAGQSWVSEQPCGST